MVPNAPAATDDGPIVTDEDTPISILAAFLLDNDTDLDGDALTLISVANASGGTAALNPAGDVVFAPSTDFNGAATFEYTVSDGNGGTDTATVAVDVTPVNDDPVAVDDGSFTTAENTATIIAAASLLGNDSDADGDSLSISGVDAVSAQGGAVALNPDGSVTYTPAGGFNGEDSFGYTVSDGKGGSATATVGVTVAELILGTNGPDVIDVSAQSSPYKIDGLKGTDTITGGSGNNTISGGASQ